MRGRQTWPMLSMTRRYHLLVDHRQSCGSIADTGFESRDRYTELWRAPTEEVHARRVGQVSRCQVIEITHAILILSWYFPPINEIGAVRVGSWPNICTTRGLGRHQPPRSRDQSLTLTLPPGG